MIHSFNDLISNVADEGSGDNPLKAYLPVDGWVAYHGTCTVFAGGTEPSNDVRQGPYFIQNLSLLSADVRREPPRFMGVAVSTAVICW
jgi:hypothetical protein